MLEDLRRELDEIAAHRGAGLRGIAHPAQQRVQPVAEFVKQGLGVVEAEQSRLALGEIVVVDDDRRHRAVEVLLIAVAARPGAGMLAGTGEIVVQKEADMGAGLVAHLPDPDIGMVDRQVRAGGKGQAEQTPGGVERRRDHVVEDEVGLHLGLVEIVSGAADLLGVVAPVPWLDRAR